MSLKWLVLVVVLLIFVGGAVLIVWSGVNQSSQQLIDVMGTQQYAAGETAVYEFRLTGSGD